MIDDASPHPSFQTRSSAWRGAAVVPRLIEIGALGGLTGVILVLVWQGLRPDLATAPTQPFFWIKAAYTGSLAVAGLLAARALARPGASPWRALGPALALAVAAVAPMEIAAAIQAGRLDASLMARLFRPAATTSCLINIVGLAAPMLALSALGLAGIEAERRVRLGLASGLFCGGVAATVYGLHCPHSTFVFVGLWYTAGVALCGLIGALAGWGVAPRSGAGPSDPSHP